MKILFLSFYYPPDLSAGSFRASSLIEELKTRDNVIVDVITTKPNRYSTFSTESKDYESDKNINIYRLDLPSHSNGMLDQIKSFSTFYFKANKLVKEKQYDIVLGTSSRLFTAFLAKRISSKKKIPVFLDIRDIFVDTIKDVLNKKVAWLFFPLLNAIEKYTFSNANHINLVSEGFYKYFKEKYPQPSYSFFTNGIDKEFLINCDNSHVCGTPITLLYAGNIGEGQGLHNIIPSLAELLGDRYKLRVIGDGGRRAILEKKCKGIKNINILPPIERKELLNEYKNADVLFLHLNDYDAFLKVLPSKLFEYAASGKPILAGVSGYAAEFIIEKLDNAEVFSPTNAEDAVLALQKLDISCVDRSIFIQKYLRTTIMQNFSNTLLSIGTDNE